MKLKLPRADALALGAAIAGLIAIVNELHWEHPVKQAVIVALALVNAIVVNPFAGEAPTSSTTGEIPAVPGASKQPEAPPAGEGGQPL